MAKAADTTPPVEKPAEPAAETTETEVAPSTAEILALVRKDVEEAVAAVMTEVLEKVQAELADRKTAHELLDSALKELEKKVKALGEKKAAGDTETLTARVDELFQHIGVIRTTFERAIGHTVPAITGTAGSEKIGAETVDGLPGAEVDEPAPAA